MGFKLKVNKRDVFRTFRHMDQMKLAIAHDAAIVARGAAQDYVNTVESGIGTTSAPSFVPGGWQALSPDWKKMKTANNDLFWIETGGIKNALAVSTIQQTMKFVRIFGGIEKWDDPDAYTRALKNEYGESYGSLGPGRPLFGPAISVYAHRVSSGGGMLVADSPIGLRFRKVPQIAAKRVYVFSGRGGR